MKRDLGSGPARGQVGAPGVARALGVEGAPGTGRPSGAGRGKVVESASAAVADMSSGASLAVGGFSLCGVPTELLAAVCARDIGDLTVYSNSCGIDDGGLGVLLQSGQIRKLVTCYVGENDTFERQYLAGELEVELTPQGTLAERLRAGGAGLAAFYTPTGVGTPITEGRETREFDGTTYLLERAITTDFALVHAWRGDRLGNLVYRKTARNLNPLVAVAARVTIAEVEELVEVGELDPDSVHTPGVYVQRVVVGTGFPKRIEQLRVRAAV